MSQVPMDVDEVGALGISNSLDKKADLMDQLLLDYFKKKGYQITKNTSTTAIQQQQQMEEEEQEESSSITLEKYAKQLGLSTESCTANHILFYCMTNDGGNEDQKAIQYEEAYGKLLEWICNSLDMYKYELHAIVFPLFVHIYLDLHTKKFPQEAKNFFMKHSKEHLRLHGEEIRQLSLIFQANQIHTNEYAQQVLHSKFNVQLSLLSFELLNTFLRDEQLFLLFVVVNERINLIVKNHQPGLLIQEFEDDDIISVNSTTNMTPINSKMKTPEDIAQIVAIKPNESESGVQVTQGDYDMEYIVHAAGGYGRNMEALHKVGIHWGVLPSRHLPKEEEVEDEEMDPNTSGDNTGAITTGSSTNSAPDGSTSSTGTSDKDKKTDGTSGSTTSGGAGPPGTLTSGTSTTGSTVEALVSPSSSGSKSSSDKKGTPTTSTSTITSGTSSTDRKTKRPKLEEIDAKKKKPSELDVQGPIPDRKSPFSAEILEKLILRRPNEIKLAELEDLRVRACLNKTQLPSALCFTFLNAHCNVNNVCFSEDTALVGASFDDASFRVWRNDDQPLGTCAGVHESAHSNVPDEEKVAILRGHSSTVYGASFSPDNRFALTSSADTTIRLWSLAARANMVCYKAHQYPVWDVNFSSLGYYFASCSMDRTARLWSTDRVHPLRVFAGHLSDVDCVQFHPNHNYLATGSSDKTVRLWDIQSGSCVRIFTGHFNGVKAIAFSPNGRYLASSGDDRYINIWDLNAGKRLETLVGHKASVYSLDFSKESTILASGGADSTVRLWDMQSLVASGSGASSVTASSSSVYEKKESGTSSRGSSVSSFVKRVTMIKPSAVGDLAPSRFLLKTLRSKQTPIYRVKFTPRNLLLTGGSFHPDATYHNATNGSGGATTSMPNTTS